MADRPRRKWRKRLLWAGAGLSLLVGVPALLFVVNGVVLASGETAQAGQYDGVPTAPAADPREVTIVSYNIAKAFAPRGGLSFNDRATVEGRLRQMADAFKAERPDFVFLSEAMTECPPCPVDQVEFLARECGLPYWSFGENYNFGLPFYRVVGGNAVLSRYPLEGVANPSLAGRQPFYVTTNNRRALFASADLGGKSVLLGSLHNDSYQPKNNAAQMEQILEFVGERPCVLAGDFNATPDRPALAAVKRTGRFVGAFDGDPSFTGEAPLRRIDYVFAPVGWEHLGTKVIPNDTSDHRPIVARFRLPPVGASR
jgi:endonuclease/exonuclease/phosphatase family metal-dependent hydrolase